MHHSHRLLGSRRYRSCLIVLKSLGPRLLPPSLGTGGQVTYNPVFREIQDQAPWFAPLPYRVISLRKAFRYLRWVRGLDHGGQAAGAIVGDSDINEFAEWQKDHLSLRGRLWLYLRSGFPAQSNHHRLEVRL